VVAMAISAALIRFILLVMEGRVSG
jgi:hypothetical protein